VSSDLILALDQGTSGTRAALVDEAGVRIAEAYQAHEQQHPAPGYVEHDPEEILRSVAGVFASVLDSVAPERVAGLGITNQRETIVLWERSGGRPLAPAIVWHDARTAKRCAELVAAGAEDLVRARTGLPLRPYFSATKLAWLLDHVPGARRRAQRGELAAGTIDAWLAWHLTGAHVSDVTNASRTLLFDIDRLDWDDELLTLFGVPRAVLPTVVPSWRAGGLATTSTRGPLGRELPLLAMLGDQQAALVGHACLSAGDAKCTYGTGAFLLVNAGLVRPRGARTLLTSIAYQAHGEVPAYCLEGAMAVAGGAIQWLVDELGLIGDPAESAALAESVPTNGGVRVVPAFQGLYAPWWQAEARGSISGLTLHSTKAHVVRATLEALAFQTRVVVDAAEREGDGSISELRIDGGVTGNAFVAQTVADVLGRPVVRTIDPEATVRGAAFAAGLAAGIWPSTAVLDGLRGPTVTIEPRWGDERREAELAGWLDAVEHVLTSP
jgi:glycerol kinase